MTMGNGGMKGIGIINDPSSTSNVKAPNNSNFIKTRQGKKRLSKAAQRQWKKQISHFEFRQHVQTLVNGNDEHIRLDGRDYPRVQDSLIEAKSHVRELAYNDDDYVWIVNPGTYSTIRHLYEFHSRIDAPTHEGEAHLGMMGTQFCRTPIVPEGWILYADELVIEGKGTIGSRLSGLRNPAMVLIENADAGLRKDVELNCGGEMTMWVINA